MPLVIDVDFTLVTAHAEKESPAPTFKHGFGFHPLWAFVDHGAEGTSNPVGLYRFLDEATQSLTTDPGLGDLPSLLNLARQVQHIGLDRVQFLTVPFESYVPNPNRLQWSRAAEDLWAQLRTDQPLTPEQAETVLSAAPSQGTATRSVPPAPPSARTAPPVDAAEQAAADTNGLCSAWFRGTGSDPGRQPRCASAHSPPIRGGRTSSTVAGTTRRHRSLPIRCRDRSRGDGSTAVSSVREQAPSSRVDRLQTRSHAGRQIVTSPRPRKPRADPNPDGTADVVDISTSMSPELTETLTSRVLGNDQVLAQLHNITERAACLSDERVATMSTPELDSAVAGSLEEKLALAELATGLAKYGLTPLDTVAGLIKLRRALVEAYRDNELVPVQTRLAALKLTHELQILEAKQSHVTAAERNRVVFSSINSALDLDTAAVDARESAVKPPARSQLVGVQSSLIQRRTTAWASGVRMPKTRPVRGGLGSLLAVMCAALGLVIGAGSSLALALPELARSTGATQTELTWVVNVYALVFAALLLPVGIAADRFGRRGALLLGLTLFATTSLASGLVGDPTVLIVLRALAGAGAAAVMPATLSVLVDAYPPERRGKAISVWAAVSGAGALLGLVLAGVLLESFWWGSVQVAFGAASLAVLALCVLVVPASRNPALSLDPLGGVLALVGLGGVVFGVVEGPERGWTDAVTLSGLAVGVLALGAFVRHELRSPHPMLDVRLFRSPGLFAGSAVVFLQFFAAFGLFFIAPQWLQYVHGQSPLQAALWLAPMALGIGPTAQVAPALLRRFGARAVAAWGMGQMATALVLLAWQADGRTGLWQFACTLFVFGVGFGLALTPATTLIIEGLPADRRTLSAAVNDVTREVGGALGGAVAASVLLAVYGDEVLDVAAGLPTPAAAAAESGIAQALGVAGGLGPAGAAVADGALHAFAAGDAASMLVGAAALFTGAVVCGLAAPSAAREQQRAPGSSKGRIGHRNRAGGRHSARAVAARTGGRPTAGNLFVTGQDGDGGGGAVRSQRKARHLQGSQPKVRSTTHRCRPSRWPESMPSRAIRAVIRRRAGRSGTRQLS